MSAQVRTVIDSLEFARTGQTLRGSLPVSGLTRLQDSLYDTLGAGRFRGAGRARCPAPADPDARGERRAASASASAASGSSTIRCGIGSTLLLASRGGGGRERARRRGRRVDRGERGAGCREPGGRRDHIGAAATRRGIRRSSAAGRSRGPAGDTSRSPFAQLAALEAEPN